MLPNQSLRATDAARAVRITGRLLLRGIAMCLKERRTNAQSWSPTPTRIAKMHGSNAAAAQGT